MTVSRHIAAAVLLALFVMGGVIAPSMHAVHHAQETAHEGMPHDEVPHCEAVPARWTADTPHADADCALCGAVFHISTPSLSALPPVYRLQEGTVAVQQSPAPHGTAPAAHSRGPPHARAHA
ncbi:MAG: hypothetical protein R6U20_04615 [Longimonas sp.]|uniref:hypothetical protein n=1 Tax=Longimonas sp. TaxID=2039626 RepID=UPI0039747707